MENEIYTNYSNHTLTVNERKNIVITGIVKIESFDEEEFLMETSMGPLVLKGSGLEIIKLDTHLGTVNIKGNIDSVTYTDTTKKKESGVFNKLFK